MEGMNLKKSIVLLFIIFLLFSNSVRVQACIEDVKIPEKGPITIMCDMTIADTSCTHEDIDGDYRVDIVSIRIINDEAYLRIKGLEKYASILNQAIESWNVYNLVHIEMNDEAYDVELLEENLGDNQVLARYIYTGDINYIVVNVYYFDNLTVNEQVHVLTHELGHALGLDDNLHQGSIMNQGLSGGTRISEFDINNVQVVIEVKTND
jgi:predicted Zn-dependent protease